MPRPPSSGPTSSRGAFDQLLRGPASQREQVFRAIVESLSEGLVVTDRQNRILFVNERTVELTRFSREQLLGAFTHELFIEPEGWEANAKRLQERVSGKEEAYELEQLCGDGVPRWFQVRATPFRDHAGKIIGTIGAMTDIESQKRLENENELLLEELRRHVNFDTIIGRSPAILRSLDHVRIVGPTDANVLITGESGTGKELIARALHELSPRRAAPLVRVNCASIPRELFESEFFGHVRGAFTGAIKDRLGRFSLADGGTLFLDEIGEVPLEQQGKLLRVLQEGTFERVGEERTRQVNVRIVAATNRDLRAESDAGRFRTDLYYRLSVFPIELPPLRERGDDIIELAQRFIEQAAQKLRIIPAPRLTQAQARELLRYPWPGNVRELQHVIERAVILSRHGRLTLALSTDATAPQTSKQAKLPAAALSPSFAELPHEGPSLKDLKATEREIILQALRKTRWRIYGPDGAAAFLELPPTTLQNRMRKHGLERHGDVHREERTRY